MARGLAMYCIFKYKILIGFHKQLCSCEHGICKNLLFQKLSSLMFGKEPSPPFFFVIYKRYLDGIYGFDPL